MTIVLDTNVLFAALTAREGFCAWLFELCISRHSIVASEHIFTELRRHLTTKSRLSAEQIETSISAIRGAVVKIVIPAPINLDACRDPNDLPILGTAIASSAQVIVTGDKDLLVLGEFQSVLILAPRVFRDRFIQSGENPIA